MTLLEFAASTVKHSLVDPSNKDDEPFYLVELAAEAMAQAIWSVDEKEEIEKMLDYCKLCTFWNLKRKVERWQSKMSAVEARSQATR